MRVALRAAGVTVPLPFQLYQRAACGPGSRRTDRAAPGQGQATLDHARRWSSDLEWQYCDLRLRVPTGQCTRAGFTTSMVRRATGARSAIGDPRLTADSEAPLLQSEWTEVGCYSPVLSHGQAELIASQCHPPPSGQRESCGTCSGWFGRMGLQQWKCGCIGLDQTLLGFTASENPSQSVELLLGEKSSAVLLVGLGNFTAVFIRSY